MTEILRRRGEEKILVGGEEISAQEALADAVWQFVVTGKVWLFGKELEATSVAEWIGVVKWLYNTIEPPTRRTDTNAEVTVRVVRGDIVPQLPDEPDEPDNEDE